MIELSPELREDIVKDFFDTCIEVGINIVQIGIATKIVETLLEDSSRINEVKEGIQMINRSLFDLNMNFVHAYHATAVTLGYVDEEEIRENITADNDLTEEQKKLLNQFLDGNKGQ